MWKGRVVWLGCPELDRPGVWECCEDASGKSVQC